jgi:hypothetical protein
VFVGEVICLTIFQGIYRDKRGFQIYSTDLPMFTIKLFMPNIASHDSLDPSFQILGIWIQGSGILDMCHQQLIFQIC